MAGSIAQLKHTYINAHSMSSKEELEAVVQLENCDIIAIMETCWDDLHNKNAAVGSYKHFIRDRQGRRGSGLDVRECFDHLELDDGDERVKHLW